MLRDRATTGQSWRARPTAPSSPSMLVCLGGYAGRRRHVQLAERSCSSRFSLPVAGPRRPKGPGMSETRKRRAAPC